MTDSEASRRHVRVLWQYLESLQGAGVQQMPRPRAQHPATGQLGSGSAAAGSQRARDVPTAPGTAKAGEHAVLDTAKLTAAPQPPPVSDGRRTKQLQLETLCQKVRACTRCPELVANRTQTVFGVGNPNARLCFFGEAPGADEDRLGEPFVGAAGQLLNRIIANACQMQRDDVYILNTLRCRPPGNRTPLPAEVENCRSHFETQLEIVHPDFICCLGGVAAQALLQTKLAVGKLRGQVHSWRWAKVVVTYHPAYLLRNPNVKQATWEDVKLLLSEMGHAI